MDRLMLIAMARGARAFAEAVDEVLAADAVLDAPNGSTADSGPGVPAAGSAESMIVVLSEFASVNDTEHRGVTRDESREIAKKAGMDPRGTAGYYSMKPSLLVIGEDGTRWVTDTGRARLQKLQERSGRK